MWVRAKFTMKGIPSTPKLIGLFHCNGCVHYITPALSLVLNWKIKR